MTCDKNVTLMLLLRAGRKRQSLVGVFVVSSDKHRACPSSPLASPIRPLPAHRHRQLQQKVSRTYESGFSPASKEDEGDAVNTDGDGALEHGIDAQVQLAPLDLPTILHHPVAALPQTN